MQAIRPALRHSIRLTDFRAANPRTLRSLSSTTAFTSQAPRHHQPTMTTGAFRYTDPATLGTDGKKPWAKVDSDVTSFTRIEKTYPVTDIRGQESNFGIDVAGFAAYHAPAAEKAFTDDAAVRGAYYAEVEALLRAKLPGVSKVVIFDHTIRRRESTAARQPVQQVHVDQTPAAAAVRVRRHVSDPDEAEKLLRGRYQIVNVWRPIGRPATDFPLAVIDARSAKLDDLVNVDLLYPTRTDSAMGAAEDDDRGREVRPDPASARSTEGYEVKGETYSVQPNPDHRFYYFKDMTPDEVMFLKCFDSRSEVNGGAKGVAGWAPHTAFVDPATPADAPGRQSIEVRCLVFYE
jgi:hypothetical protein